MRIAAISYGTEGDIRPMLALGRELAGRGHSMVLAGDASGAALAERVGVDFVPLSGDLRTQLNGPGELGDIVRRGGQAVSGIKPVRTLLTQHLHRWTVDLLRASEGVDVVLSSGLSLPAGFNVAEALDVPVVATFFQPFAASRHLKSSMLPPRMPLPLHAPLFRLGNQAAWGMMRATVNSSRAQLGLAPRRALWRNFRQLGAWSPTLAAAPPDWGDEIKVVGQWPLATGTDWAPDPALAEFLAAGPAPVYVGFGSMAVPADLLRDVVAGLDGRRALVAPGWSAALPGSLPDSVHVVGQVPHEWLFRRVDAVVHHCGAGTTHTAVRAGAVSIPVPITADQPFWADRLFQLGLGTRPIPPRRVTPDEIRRALDQVDALRPGVSRAAEQVASEDGCAAAVRSLEQLAERRLAG